MYNVFKHCLCAAQKELGQKDRLLQQQQQKLDEGLRKLTDSSSQQVRHQTESADCEGELHDGNGNAE